MDQDPPDTEPPQEPPTPPAQVLYACVATQKLPDGQSVEVVPCLIVQGPTGHPQSLPLVAIGEAAAKNMRLQAQHVADAMGKPLRVVSAPMQDAGSIEPNLISVASDMNRLVR